MPQEASLRCISEEAHSSSVTVGNPMTPYYMSKEETVLMFSSVPESKIRK